LLTSCYFAQQPLDRACPVFGVVDPSQQVVRQQSPAVFRPDATGFVVASSQHPGGQQSGGQHSPKVLMSQQPGGQHSPGTLHAQHPGGQQPSPRLELA
jgi:hypothetical protein